MITGEKTLRQIYPTLEDNQYQPAGIDLTIDKLARLEHDDGMIYGLLKNAKVLPKQVELKLSNIQVGGMLKSVFVLDPHTSYIATTKEKIKISKNAGQFYFPRSSLLRAGIDVRTAFGDPGFHGHLSFLIINHSDVPFFIKKGERFAQMITEKVDGVMEGYDGDYNE